MTTPRPDHWPWDEPGRDLDEVPPPLKRRRIVACLNIWDDVDELRATWDSWYPHVDRVVAVDGAYRSVAAPTPASTDGTLEFLARFPNVTVIPAAGFWTDQVAKRTAYCNAVKAGEYLFVVDADELVWDAERLRALPTDLDVGWVTVWSPLYQRPQQQPRVFRKTAGLRYTERHHWIVDNRGPVATHQQGAPGRVHRLIDVALHNNRGRNRTDARRDMAWAARLLQTDHELTRGPRGVGHEPLRIVQCGPFDPGMVMFRFHSAINSTSPHHSVMATVDAPAFAQPAQLLVPRDHLLLADVLATCDVVHNHVQYTADLIRESHGPVVMHHHGTEYRRDPAAANRQDAARAHLRLVSNLELLQYGRDLHYLPNPVPVARLQAFAHRQRRVRDGRFRVVHSPSKPQIKGTEVFLRACAALQQQGLPVEPVVLTDRTPLADVLTAKATADAVFDSFWLGLQVSGLEGAAMGLPVLAGDPDCVRAYREWLGEVPYTYANDGQALQEQIERLMTDPAFYAAERDRVTSYVAQHHDGAAVVARYLNLLDGAVQWRERLQLKAAVAA